MASNRSNNEFFKYGICLNEECSKGKSKEIQKIPFRKELICEECGKELRECNPPKKKNNKIIYLLIVGLVVIIAGTVFFLNIKDNKTDTITPIDKQPKTKQHETECVSDTVQPVISEEYRDTNVSVAVPQIDVKKASSENSAKHTLDYGKWSGGWKSGKPHGMGTITFTKQHLIDNRDPKKRIAEHGDYIIGEFNNGRLVQGVWYDSSNNVKGSIIIGM